MSADAKGNSITVPVRNAWSAKDEKNGLHHLLLELEHGWVIQLTQFPGGRVEKGVGYHPTLSDALDELKFQSEAQLTPEPTIVEERQKKGGFVLGVESGNPKMVKNLIIAGGLAAKHAIHSRMALSPESGAEIPMCRALDELGPLATAVLVQGLDKVPDSTAAYYAATQYNLWRCIFEWQFFRTCAEAGERSYTIQQNSTAAKAV